MSDLSRNIIEAIAVGIEDGLSPDEIGGNVVVVIETTRALSSIWRDISTAPRDGTHIIGRRTFVVRYTGKLRHEKRVTYWGKTSHVPLYGWNFGLDPEDQTMWNPTHWKPVQVKP